MAGQTTYEVYVLQGTRWEIHSRYNAQQKDAAIQEAKTLEATPGIDSTKVVKEVYDPKEGLAEEFTVYKSESLKKKAPSVREVFAGASPTAARAVRQDDSSPKRSAKGGAKGRRPPPRTKGRRSGRKSSMVGVVVKVLLIMLFSIAIAALFTGIGAMNLPYRDAFGISLSGNSRTNVLFIIFLVSFILSALLTAKSFLRKSDFESSGRSAPPAPQPARRPHVATLPRNLDIPRSSFDELPLPERSSERQEEQKQQTKEEANGAKPSDLPPEVEQQKRYMMKFLGESLGNVKAGAQKMDNFNKFGVNLYLAGASEALAQRKGLDDSAEARILAEGVQVMGFNRQAADSFAQKKEEYLLADSRYMQMYQAGRNALNSSLEGDTEAAKLLNKALGEWNKPKTKQASGGPITVMFTDMVGSTAMTQSKGDAAAQEVVRAHNRIVRAALSQFAGREIKHTGDGIMASFDTTSHGVEAAIFIQQGAQAHTRSNPDLPLRLKIGINAGEPIREDDDLFGSTVQLSARITDKANAGQVLVSEIVRGICVGKDLAFRNAGGFSMKGFAEPITLYEVIWNKAAANDAAAEAVAAQ